MAKNNKLLLGGLILLTAGVAAFFLLRKKKLDCSISVKNKAGLTVTVDASVSGGVEPYSVAILWGDGDVTEDTKGGSFSHTYPNPGKADIVLSVKDKEGTLCSKSILDYTV